VKNINLINEKLVNDINRLRLSEDVSLDPGRFGQSIGEYKEMMAKANEMFVENRELLVEVGKLMEEIVVVVKENERLINKGIEVAEGTTRKKKKSEYEMVLKELNELNREAEGVTIYGNINNLF